MYAHAIIIYKQCINIAYKSKFRRQLKLWYIQLYLHACRMIFFYIYNFNLIYHIIIILRMLFIIILYFFPYPGLAHSWGTTFSRALPSTAYPPYLANNCGPPTFQHSNFTNIFPYNGTNTEVNQQTINTSSGNNILCKIIEIIQLNNLNLLRIV